APSWILKAALMGLLRGCVPHSTTTLIRYHPESKGKLARNCVHKRYLGVPRESRVVGAAKGKASLGCQNQLDTRYCQPVIKRWRRKSVSRYTNLYVEIVKCIFLRTGHVARSRIWLRISGSAMVMPLLIYGNGFS